jgi:NAD(P)-dependent dehydrogenase (short-subunit alcohol dehydrogenase family)
MTLPNFRLDGQTAFVTGAASGIGRAIALGIAASGQMSRASTVRAPVWRRSRKR